MMGVTAPYKLILTGGSPSPSGREISEEDAILDTKMLKAIYDTDNDGIVDKTEGVRDLDTLPMSPVEGEIAAKDGKLYVAVTS
jgi:hypothetical protein